ncbi:aminotransferase class V-fold PLP-dependent enzyme [Pedobacter mucosus]|uniref:aminotransferase class V-fold PLP-dependent enzyme n=1 Tax=Pedobacter mucosus TaxID=2895286 RepID=UPI001EE463F3|nr:aminotransferase class V-fold PLP-dependent enzyme [Pedobacter mucosus]UKT62174.1 aminotransferase class V-fold PLP-dependent enzyme [Pedobacter mucosus]
MNFSEQFPILANVTYFNTAYSGILSKDLQAWRKNHDEEFLASGSAFRLNAGIFIQEVRENVARLFKAKSKNIFLVPNFSFGFNTLLDGLSKDNKFLLLSEDYPSVNYPITSRGFKCDFVKIDTEFETNIVEAIRRFKPAIFAFSMVQYISGIKMSIEFIKKLKVEFPDLILLADGTQFCGTAAFDFENSGLDAVLSSGYKWMLSGFGNGFVLLNDRLKDLLYQDRKKLELPKEPFLAGKDHLTICFEPGHLDTLNFGTLNQSVLNLEKIGLQNIENSTQILVQKAKAEFELRKLVSAEVVARKEHSTILSLSLKPEIVTNLEKENIICSARGAGTRFSFHYYNTEQDLKKLLSVIDSF